MEEIDDEESAEDSQEEEGGSQDESQESQDEQVRSPGELLIFHRHFVLQSQEEQESPRPGDNKARRRRARKAD